MGQGWPSQCWWGMGWFVLAACAVGVVGGVGSGPVSSSPWLVAQVVMVVFLSLFVVVVCVVKSEKKW